MHSTQVETHTAAKPHRCDWCWQRIDAGTAYNRYRCYGGGDASTVKMHPECYGAMQEAAREEGGWIEWTPGQERPAAILDEEKEQTMDQVQIAAKMAGDWWAERLHDKYAERRPALAAAVAQRVADALNGAAHWDFQGNRCDGSGKPEAKYWVKCDYEPKGLLANAVAEVFNDMKPWQLFSSSQDLFPYKHELRVTRDALHPKEGYGNWTADIRVPACGAV